MRHPIQYSAEMAQRVERMHAGAEQLPGYAGWITDHLGGRVVAFRQRLIPQILAFTDLHGLDVLDFGCGTGSSTVALWERARDCRFTALDVDRDGLEIARLRFRHHGIEDRVDLRAIVPVQRVGDLPLASATFDFVLANGVLEHVVPFSMRSAVVGEMWRLLRPGGLLFISETPNPLWPIDRHTTGLPFLPWLPSGLATRLAIAAGRHRPGADLDARGRRGMSYFAIKRAVGDCEVLNLTVTRNRLLPAGPPPAGQRPAPGGAPAASSWNASSARRSPRWAFQASRSAPSSNTCACGSLRDYTRHHGLAGIPRWRFDRDRTARSGSESILRRVTSGRDRCASPQNSWTAGFRTSHSLPGASPVRTLGAERFQLGTFALQCVDPAPHQLRTGDGMRELVDRERLLRFLEATGRAAGADIRLYFTGGASAVLVGWRSSTVDVDILMVPEDESLFRAIPRLKEELRINVELAAPSHFIPELPGWRERSQYIDRIGKIAFYHYDFYSQALAKIQRGHAMDRVDVEQMIQRSLVERSELRRLYETIEPLLYRFPAIDPPAFRAAVRRVTGEP